MTGPEEGEAGGPVTTVTVDLDDVDTIRVLATGFLDRHGAPNGGNRVNAMQDALRALIVPAQAVEPTGLGAVVEGCAYTAAYLDESRVFVRGPGNDQPWIDHTGDGHAWAELDVDKVLSEGMLP